MNKLRAARIGLAILPLLATFGTGCKRDPCDGVMGSCLALNIRGSGTYDKLQATLSLTDLTTRSADLPNVQTVPLATRMIPPPGVSSSTISAIRVTGVLGDTAVVTGDALLSWPDGSHIDATVTLYPGDGDGGHGPFFFVRSSVVSGTIA